MLVWIDSGGFKGRQSGIFISNGPSSGIMVSKSVAGGLSYALPMVV